MNNTKAVLLVHSTCAILGATTALQTTTRIQIQKLLESLDRFDTFDRIEMWMLATSLSSNAGRMKFTVGAIQCVLCTELNVLNEELLLGYVVCGGLCKVNAQTTNPWCR